MCDKSVFRVFSRGAAIEAVGLIVHAAFRNRHPEQTIPLKIVKGAARGIDRDLVEIRSAEPRELRVLIRKEAVLKQRVVGELNARHDVGGVMSARDS